MNIFSQFVLDSVTVLQPEILLVFFGLVFLLLAKKWYPAEKGFRPFYEIGSYSFFSSASTARLYLLQANSSSQTYFHFSFFGGGGSAKSCCPSCSNHWGRNTYSRQLLIALPQIAKLFLKEYSRTV